MFCLFNQSSPIFNLFVLSIGLKISVTIFVPPIFWMFSNIDNFQVLIPYLFSITSKQLNNLFKDFFSLNIHYIKSLNSFY